MSVTPALKERMQRGEDTVRGAPVRTDKPGPQRAASREVHSTCSLPLELLGGGGIRGP